MYSNLNKWSAEFVGTFWLTFGGCGSAVLAAAFPEVGIGWAGVALAHSSLNSSARTSWARSTARR